MKNILKLFTISFIGLMLFGCQKGVEKAAVKTDTAPDAHAASGHDHPAAEHPAAGGAAGAHGGAVGVETVSNLTEVPSDITTIANIYTNKNDLNGKKVSIRGKVAKVNSGIMGKNWLHIQDGTGSEGTNDITVTTQGIANVDNTVVLTGVLAVDKTIGANYHYPVIIEDALIKVE